MLDGVFERRNNFLDVWGNGPRRVTLWAAAVTVATLAVKRFIVIVSSEDGDGVVGRGGGLFRGSLLGPLGHESGAEWGEYCRDNDRGGDQYGRERCRRRVRRIGGGNDRWNGDGVARRRRRGRARHAGATGEPVDEDEE